MDFAQVVPINPTTASKGSGFGGGHTKSFDLPTFKKLQDMRVDSHELNCCFTFLRSVFQTDVRLPNGATTSRLASTIGAAIEQLNTLGFIVFMSARDEESGFNFPVVVDASLLRISHISCEARPGKGVTRCYTIDFIETQARNCKLFVLEDLEFRPSSDGRFRSPVRTVLGDWVEFETLRMYFLKSEQIRSECLFAIEETASGAVSKQSTSTVPSLGTYTRANALVFESQQRHQQELAGASNRNTQHDFVASLKGIPQDTNATTKAREWEIPSGYKYHDMSVPSQGRWAVEQNEWLGAKIASSLGIPGELLFRQLRHGTRQRTGLEISESLTVFRQTCLNLQRKLSMFITKAFWVINNTTRRVGDTVEITPFKEFVVESNPVITVLELKMLRDEHIISQRELTELGRRTYSLPNANEQLLKKLEEEDNLENKALQAKQMSKSAGTKPAATAKKRTEKGQRVVNSTTLNRAPEKVLAKKKKTTGVAKQSVRKSQRKTKPVKRDDDAN